MKKTVIMIVSFLCFSLVYPQVVLPMDTPVLYEAVEVKPVFPGGITEFMKFVMKNYQVPEEEEGGGATGIVQVSIVIDATGTVSKIDILQDVGTAGKEIKRVLSKCPKWTPGRNKGLPVSVVYNFPITIK